MVVAVISQMDTSTTCRARVGEYDDGVFERVMRTRIRMMSDAWGSGRRLWCAGVGSIVPWRWLCPPQTTRRLQQQLLRAKCMSPRCGRGHPPQRPRGIYLASAGLGEFKRTSEPRKGHLAHPARHFLSLVPNRRPKESNLRVEEAPYIRPMLRGPRGGG